MTYIELHAKSAFSFLEAAALPETLAERAAALGQRALALVDRARDHQVRARAELHEGDPSGALAQTRVARGLAKRALQIAGSAEL